ncbi:putative enoyl-[acyl-carrier-protein] reductase II [Anaerofustis stercorihominis DSM 17244]|uniref:Probable nitronate monooxygenase n=2 Tax=Anaerofustis stercorihominis TaxID=214853 RepID=B1CA73_9FIRM|nr:putative enoyl-[acyl-carrier-protein] reductase II [Anaerofustis stercorihominis DSM 17244]
MLRVILKYSRKVMVMLNKMLGIKYPIIQGAMANIATAEFAACVSNAGGLGIIGTGAMTCVQAKEEIKKCKSLTYKPFGVNVMMMNPETEEIMNMLCEEKVSVVTTGAGNPGKYVEALKKSGAKVFPISPSVALAKRLARAGVDAIIVEGGESGGHVGEQTTMALVPQIVDAVDVPVIAAGGIADGRGFNAALSLGAIGVQVGTCLLVSEECPIHENYKAAVLKAKDTDTIVTGKSLNAPVRVLKNKMSKEYIKLETSLANREELEKLTLGGLRKAVFEGDMVTGSVMMGQIAGMCKEIMPMKDILKNIMDSSKRELEILIEKHKELEC